MGVYGYGVASLGKAGSSGRAHKVVWERLRGPVPDGLVLDHLCRNRACVNPDHLEPVTQRVNSLRGVGAAAQQARKTHCKYGHEYTSENTQLYINQHGNVSRQCKVCGYRRDRGAPRNACADRAHCPKGHAYAGDNLRLHERKNGKIWRVCKTCQRDYMRAKRAARSAS